MQVGGLYFIKDDFYERFQGFGLIGNKESGHDRPCCYMFKMNKDDDMLWMIPISSRIEKYKAVYDRSVEKYGRCDNISFGYVLGKEKAFLIQNMFPVTEEYIKNAYVDNNTNSIITMPRDFIAHINAKARRKYSYNFKGVKFGMTDIVSIYNSLISDKSAT